MIVTGYTSLDGGLRVGGNATFATGTETKISNLKADEGNIGKWTFPETIPAAAGGKKITLGTIKLGSTIFYLQAVFAGTNNTTSATLYLNATE
jgi:hypothetical protein